MFKVQRFCKSNCCPRNRSNCLSFCFLQFITGCTDDNFTSICPCDSFRQFQCGVSSSCCGCKLGPGGSNIHTMEVSKAKHTKCLSTKVGSIGQGLILSVVVARQDQVEIVGEWFLLGSSLQLSSSQKKNFHIQSSVFSVFNFQSCHALHYDHSEWGWVHIQHHPGSWWNADCVPFHWHCQA